MIRVVTVDELDEKQIEKFCKVLYTAFGVGCEWSGQIDVPAGMSEPLDAYKLMEKAPSVTSYEDDKILYVTTRKLKDREVPSGTAPTHGCALYGENRAVISLQGTLGLEDGLKHVSRHALHQLGHLWELHHCLDPRCSMYPPWTPSFPQGDSIFCNYCRDKSERKLRLAKS
jgi:archaemetzincin